MKTNIDFDLEQKTLSQLADLYNEAAKALNKKQVKKFSTREIAVRRTEEILEELKAQPQRATRQKHFVFDPILPVKEARENTLRMEVLKALKKGTTFESVKTLVEKFDDKRGKKHFNIERRAYEAIRLVHYQLGYGLKQDEKGKIFAYESKTN